MKGKYPRVESPMDSILIAACSRKYHECVEKFLRSIGVTEHNAGQYELRTHQGDELNAEIWHNGVKVGEVVTRWETESGCRFVVECKSA